MMEIYGKEIDKKELLVTALVALLVATGATVFDKTVLDATNELEGYYVCDVLGVDSIKEYARLSGTKYTAYPYADSNTGRKYCKTSEDVKGTWFTLEEYALELGVDPYSLLEEKPLEETPSPVVESETPTPVVEPVLLPVYSGESAKVKCGQKGCYTV